MQRCNAGIVCKGALAASFAFLLVACANRPESIHASYVSYEKYMDLDCAALVTKQAETRAELADYSEKQNAKANGDAVGVFLLGIPFSKLSGDVEGDVARLKGEVEAIDTAQIKKKCRSLGRGVHEAAAPAKKVEVGAPETVALAARQDHPPEYHPPGIPGLPAAGTSWRYEFSDRLYGAKKSIVTVRVNAVKGEWVDEQVSAEPPAEGVRSLSRDIQARSERFELYPVGGNYVLTEFAPYLLAAGGEEALAHVAPGGDAGGYPKSGYSGWVTKTMPPVWERVSVPAGTFRVLHFAIRGHREVAPFSPIPVYRFEIGVWYAPAVKRYVRLEHKTWLNLSRPDGDDVVELVEYRPPF